MTLSGLLPIALQKSTRDLNIGEKSCISTSFPSRLPYLDVGAVTLFPLQQAVVNTVRSLVHAVVDLQLVHIVSVSLPMKMKVRMLIILPDFKDCRSSRDF